MYNRILVPVDGSKFSEEVLPYAHSIATSSGAKLTLLRVVEKDAQRVEAQRYLEALAAGFDAEARTVTSDGEVSVDILQEANRDPGTLVAITSHGRGGVLTAMLGSVARNVVRGGRAPVFVYRPGSEPVQHEPIVIKTILLPLDGTSLSESMEEQAATWAQTLKAGLVIVQVLPANARIEPILGSHDVLEDSYLRRPAREIQRRFGIDVDWEVLHGDPVSAISNFLGGRRDALIVMATHGRPALQAAVLGSVASGLLHQTGVPLIVQAPDKSRLDASAPSPAGARAKFDGRGSSLA
jgi:nucleotide-binding universal stress UspA family protein